MPQAVQLRLTELLGAMNDGGGFPLSLVCAADGLLIACAGDPLRSETVASLTGLFADIARRTVTDLGYEPADELTVSSGARGRVVVRPLAASRLFLVVQVPRDRSWRRRTAAVARAALEILGPLLAP